jgi:glycosyltransferase involved in cell wall biosynthesis
MRIAFYAPLKPPDHPVPSGDREMARRLLAALAAGGHSAAVASRFRCFDGEGNAARQAELRAQGTEEARRLVGRGAAGPGGEPPQAWLTYHLYHKAPDFLGPTVASALGIPYLVAEASHAPKRAQGPWAAWHVEAAAAISRADAVLAVTARDAECLRALVRPPARLLLFPPFVDATPFAAARRGRDAHRAALAARLAIDAAAPWILAVGMMRARAKLASYALLARALRRLPDLPWHLLVVGDGPARGEVERALAGLGPRRVELLGEVAPETLPAVYATCDVYAWPAADEAYGMALLEAQAAGLPAVAGREGGVPDVARDGTTALLVPPRDPAVFAEALRALLTDPERRRRMGEAAAAFVCAERDLPAAAARLDCVLALASGAARRPATPL